MCILYLYDVLLLSLYSPQSEGESVLPDPTIPATIAPSSETPETHTTESSDQQLPHVEENTVLPLEKDGEEPISSTITLLDKEEESDDKNEKGAYRDQKQGIPIHCSVPSFSSLCSCNASLQEYLHQQCSASLSNKRKCQAAHQKQTIPSVETPAWQRPLLPSGWHEPQQPHSEVHQPREQEQAAESEPESKASSSEAPQPPENTASYKDSILELPLLEPSQTSNLPKHSVTDSSSAKPTPGVETPLLSAGEPEKKQDVLAEERHIEPSAPPSGSSHVQPTVSITADESSVVLAEETLHADVSHSDINTPDKTDQILCPTSSSFYPDPPFHEADSVSPEEPNLVPDLGADPEPSSGHPVITDPKTEDISDDASTAAPSATAPPVSSSPSDIYADPPNGTEQNGIPVHGSSQKESVFMRLNNRIKALEMNMSLSGRYLEQLSQR